MEIENESEDNESITIKDQYLSGQENHCIEDVEKKGGDKIQINCPAVIDNECFNNVNIKLCNTNSLFEEDDTVNHNIIAGSNFECDFCPMNQNFNLIEVGRCSWESNILQQKYLRGCLWSPDGTCVLTAVNGEGMQVFEIPPDLYQSDTVSKLDRKLSPLMPAIAVPESGTVYDYNWFPQMNSNDPETCCWIATRQHEPMHMWDAFTGELRCSYRGYDPFDEVETAISSTFSPDGQHIIGGYKKTLKIFDTSIPGRDYTEIKAKCAVSTIAMHYFHPNMIISGSWNSSMNIFDLRAPNLGCLTTIRGHSGGITLLKLDSNGEKLFSGARKDNLILQWDLRNFKLPVEQYKRNVGTNQKIYFDLSPCNKYLLSGGTDGVVKAWNLESLEESRKELKLNLHDDCCNGVGFSTIRPVISTTSGQFKFLNDKEEEILNSSTNCEANDIEIVYENSLVLWWYGKNDE